jgi:dipeptidyl-peptidase-4
MNDGINYTSFTNRAQSELAQYSYKTGKSISTIVKVTDIKVDGIQAIEDYEFSADESKLVIAYNTESIYRYSSKANYVVYDLKKKETKKLDEELIMYATLSPQGNKVAFVKNNNLYWQDLESGKTTQITSDGEWNKIINGASDWVYEEELELVRAFEWSPDGKNIAFFRFDESNVKEFSMDIYGDLYPEEYTFKYPKAGEENSKVSIHIYNLETKKTIQANLGSGWEYVARIEWTKNPKKLAVQTLNRHQNDLNILLVDATSGEAKNIYNEKSATYIEIPNHLTFLDNGNEFVLLSEKDGFKHIYLYNMKGEMVKQLTKGNWEVTDFYGVDQVNQKIYFQSAKDSPLQREIDVVDIKSGEMTCLSSKKGANDADFSKNFAYYINYYSNANTPQYITLNNSKGKEIRVLQDNARLKETIKKFEWQEKEFFTINNADGDELNAWMIKPANFDASKKYPVFMFVYGGPGSQTVQDQWGSGNDSWFQMLAQNGYLVVSVDNRGTGARGANFKKVTYKQLGKYEVEDQIDAAKYLASQSYVDPERIGIFGWSYGGYMTSLCLTKGADVFKMGIAVAPVTTWRYYDTIYTERYMQTPQENPSGYDDNSPINHVKKLKGKYFLIHGMADDNVHYQNAVDMSTALIEMNKPFDQFSYPNKNHGIYGGLTRMHLYTMMTEYIYKNL